MTNTSGTEASGDCVRLSRPGDYERKSLARLQYENSWNRMCSLTIECVLLLGDYEHKSPARLQYEEFLRQLTCKMEAEKVHLLN